MTFLITIWIISVITLISTVVAALYGVRSANSARYLSRGTPAEWTDLYILTHRDISRVIVDKWHDLLPYVHNATTYVLSKFIANRDRFYAKVFGYPAVPHGGVVSFFLKRIVAHKEEFRQKVEHRRALHDTVSDKKHRHAYADLKSENKIV